MGAPPTQYPLGQSQSAGAYAAQGWGAAAYQQWPGQQSDPCRDFQNLTEPGFVHYLHVLTGSCGFVLVQPKPTQMQQRGPHTINSSNSSFNSLAVGPPLANSLEHQVNQKPAVEAFL